MTTCTQCKQVVHPTPEGWRDGRTEVAVDQSDTLICLNPQTSPLHQVA